MSQQEINSEDQLKLIQDLQLEIKNLKTRNHQLSRLLRKEKEKSVVKLANFIDCMLKEDGNPEIKNQLKVTKSVIRIWRIHSDSRRATQRGT